MESVVPSEPTDQPQQSESAPSSRDPDLVALEGFESEFAELETELERVERPSANGPAADEPAP